MTTLAPPELAAPFIAYGNLVYSAALRQVRSPELAEDVTQATFIILAKQTKPIPTDYLAGWLIKTTHYCAKNALRLEGRRRRHETLAAARRSPVTNAIDPALVEISHLLDEAMARLAARESTALALRYLESKPMLEVAAALNTSADAAQKIVAHGLLKLRKLLTRKGVILPTAAALAVALERVPAHAAPAKIGTAAPSAHSAMIAHSTLQAILWSKIALPIAAAILAAGAAVTVMTQLNSAPPPPATPPSQAPAPAAAVAPPPPIVDYLSSADSPFLQLVGCRIKQTIDFHLTANPQPDLSAKWTDQQYNQVHWTVDPALAPQVDHFSISLTPAEDSTAAQNFTADKTEDTQWLQDLPSKPGKYVVTVSAIAPDAKPLAVASANVTVRPLPVTQVMIQDYQPDGTIRFTFVGQYMNVTHQVLSEGGLMDDEDIHVTSMADQFGKPVQFTATHNGQTVQYHYQLNEPVPPGTPLMGANLGLWDATHSRVITDLGGGQFRYAFAHHPGGNVPVRRVELSILPAGATLIRTIPGDLPHQTVDGRVQVFVDNLIPPDGSERVVIEYNLPPHG